VVGPVTRDDVPALCQRLRVLADRSGADGVACDVRALVADIVGVEALARLQLTARRVGCGVRLRHPSRELEELLDLCGLGGVLAGDGPLVGPIRQAEERKQAGRVEEGADPGDPPP
jgi:ABC-type transporter Mla MlaB component